MSKVRYLVSSKHHTQILSLVFITQILPNTRDTDWNEAYTVLYAQLKRGIQYLF